VPTHDSACVAIYRLGNNAFSDSDKASIKAGCSLWKKCASDQSHSHVTHRVYINNSCMNIRAVMIVPLCVCTCVLGCTCTCRSVCVDGRMYMRRSVFILVGLILRECHRQPGIIVCRQVTSAQIAAHIHRLRSWVLLICRWVR
jgi:hypothetical protein